MMSPTTRWAPVLAVLLLAPWFAEFSWGGYPVQYLPVAWLFVGPMYGGAALLVREVAVRTGHGWPSVVLLAAAFGVLQSGIVDQSLFNPAYGRFDFQHPAHVDGIDVSLYWLVAFVSGHVVASIVTPLVVVQTWSRRPSEPWLGRRGLRLVVALYLLATAVNFVGVKDEDGAGFQARPLQTLVAAATVAVLIGAALRWRRRTRTEIGVPAPWLLGVLGFVAYLLYLPGESTWAAVVGVVVVVAAVAVIGTWSRSHHWTPAHPFALVMGSALTGVVMPFLVDPYDDSVGDTAQLLGATAAAVVCATIVAATIGRHRRTPHPIA